MKRAMTKILSHRGVANGEFHVTIEKQIK